MAEHAKVLYSYHVHDEEGWCVQSYTRWSDEAATPNAQESLQAVAQLEARNIGGTVHGPLGYSHRRCNNPPVHPDIEERIVAKAKATPAAEPELQAFHVHTDTDPYCRSFHKSADPEENRKRAANAMQKYGGEVVGPLNYNATACAYKAEMEAEQDDEAIEDEAEADEEVEEDGVIEPDDEDVEDSEVDDDEESEDEADEPASEDDEDEDESPEELIEEDDDEDESDADVLGSDDAEDDVEVDDDGPEVLEAEPVVVSTTKSKAKSSKSTAPAAPAASKAAAKPAKAATTASAAPEPLHVKATAPVKKDDEVDLTKLECSGCGGSLDGHKCPSASKRTGVKRKSAEEHPSCPHCGGRVHWNNGGAMVNAECLLRQFYVETGAMSDPNGRLPIFTTDTAEEMAKWIKAKKKAGVELTYGKMDSAAGAATYSGIKGAAAKVAKAAAPGTRIEDIAASTDDDDEVVEAPVPVKKETKKERLAREAAESQAKAEAEEAEARKAKRALLKKGTGKKGK